MKLLERKKVAQDGIRSCLNSFLLRKKTMKLIKFFTALVLLQISLHVSAEMSKPNNSRVDEVENIPWEQRSYEDKVMNARYEDHYTFKHGKPYIVDPWTWGYTKAFADRFRMPKQWIEPELKGALAVAWRMTTIGNTMCGYGGKEDNCWKPLNCQMDVYYDNKIPLPWVKPEVTKDNRMVGLSSSKFLEIPPKEFTKELPPPTGGPFGGGAFLYGKYNEAGGYIANFDRNFQEGVGVISYVGAGVCPTKSALEYADSPGVHTDFSNYDDFQKYINGKLKKEEVRVEHRIDFPKSLLQRMNAIYEVQKTMNDEVMNGLLKGFFEQRKNQIPSAK